MNAHDPEGSYDRVAEAYARQFFGELAHKPFDRTWLDRFAALTVGRGPVCDLGCGPGQIARYLHERGVDVFGADLSEGMLREARRLNPAIRFERQDMLQLTLPRGELAGIVAFYAICHLTPDEAEIAFREFGRILAPGGHALIAFHVGDERRHVDEFLGHPVSLNASFFQPDDIIARLAAAGLQVEEVTMRYPYPDVEYPSKRAYILARKPA